MLACIAQNKEDPRGHFQASIPRWPHSTVLMNSLWVKWHTSLILALGRQRQEDLCEFEASLVYRASSKTARATQRNPVSKKQRNKQKDAASQTVYAMTVV